jgi:hypothetical protein
MIRILITALPVLLLSSTNLMGSSNSDEEQQYFIAESPFFDMENVINSILMNKETFESNGLNEQDKLLLKPYGDRLDEAINDALKICLSNKRREEMVKIGMPLEDPDNNKYQLTLITLLENSTIYFKKFLEIKMHSCCEESEILVAHVNALSTRIAKLRDTFL